MIDAFRYFAMLECLLVIGVTVALYERIGRFVLPLRTMRTIFASLILMNAVSVGGIYERLGQGLNWRTPTVVATMTLYLGGLVSLWFYYRGPEGRRQRHGLVNIYAANEVARYLRVAKRISDDVDEHTCHAGRAFPPRWSRLGRWFKHQ